MSEDPSPSQIPGIHDRIPLIGLTGKVIEVISKIYSGVIHGVEGQNVTVEADSNNGLPGTCMVGYLSSEVREAQERARTAIRGSGFALPPKKTVINLSPASVRKAGTSYDLGIALAILASLGVDMSSFAENSVFIGELGLDGKIKAVRGVLPIVTAAKGAGFRRCYIPEENFAEGNSVEGMEIITPRTLEECIRFLHHPEEQKNTMEKLAAERKTSFVCEEEERKVDFSEVNGQLMLRRAAEIAAAGRHNLLIIGAAGTGKTMVAQRMPTILPPMEEAERIEISKIYSICGLLPPGKPLVSQRPFRSPHHTVSPQALAGGGSVPKPGELSLASGGVLFLDELPEFAPRAIEILRQPLEERSISISRLHGTYVFPANFILVAAMNPCPCGYYPDRGRCRCSRGQIQHYLGKISKPILERFDICAEGAPMAYQDFRREGGETSEAIRERVIKAWNRQRDRFVNTGIRSNGEMGIREIKQHCRLRPSEETFLEQIYTAKKLSGRSVHKILRVARTIADLADETYISKIHLAEAVSYRGLEDKYWGGGTA